MSISVYQNVQPCSHYMLHLFLIIMTDITQHISTLIKSLSILGWDATLCIQWTNGYPCVNYNESDGI